MLRATRVRAAVNTDPIPSRRRGELILMLHVWAIRLTSCFVCLQDHQTYNAKEMADLGAAVEIRDVDLAPKQSSPNTAGQKNDGEPAPRRHVRLEYVIGELLYDTEVLAGMRESCLDAAHPEAADAIANDVVSIALAARRKRRGSKAAA